MKLEIAMLVGPEAKQFLVGLTQQLDRMEKLQGAKPAEPEQEEEVEAEEEDFAAPVKAKRGRPKKEESFDDAVGEEEVVEEEEEVEEEEVKPAKKAKAAKVTVDDVNDAAKARALRSTRAEVLAIFKKQFKVASISELDPSQYADVIKALK